MNDEEAREYLQLRLAVLFKLMFWSLVALVGFVAAQYAVYSDIAPKHRLWVYGGSAVMLGIMGLIWRLMLVRKPQSFAVLRRLDLVYSAGLGVSFGASALLQYEIAPAAYMALIYSASAVFARALIVPSSALRTAVASCLTYLPMTAAAVALALAIKLDLPGPAFVTGYLLLSIVPIVLATLGSHIIYDLQRRATSAQQIGMYKLEARIGAGGMGEVHRAHHLLLRRSTAVKLLLPDRIDAESLARFEREVQATSLLTHPNTIAIYDYGHTAEGMFYYAMEYLDGGIDLEKLVARYGKQPPARVVRILVQICGALQEAHDQNLIHRDIKPANIMLCERGGMPDIAKVLDFGLVKEIRGDAAASTQIVLGTPGYVAPETTTGVVGPAGDLYCLGCVTYFLLTGKRVFDAKSNIDLFVQHVTARPAAPSQLAPGLPPELDAVVLRCLEKEPDARFANATALADALRAVPLAEPWSDAQARTWWAARRKAEADALATAALETRTITVNLDVRVSAA